MLRKEDFGPIRLYEFTRTVLGQRVMRVGAYRVDGLLIDCGPARAAELLAQVVDDGPVDDLVLTHHHEDHSGNASALAQRTGCRVHVHAAGRALVESPGRIPAYRRAFWGAAPATAAIALGDEVRTEHFCFRVIHTPGHAPDHVALYEPDQGWLFVGDLYLTDRPQHACVYDDLGEIIASLRTLLSLRDCTMFCQHTGRHPSHHHRLGRKLDALLGLQHRAVMHRDEGLEVAEIARAMGLRDGLLPWLTQGEISAHHLVVGLLRHADATA